MRRFTVAILLCLSASPVAAQNPLAVADSLYDALRPAEALAWYQKALARDSTSYEANWKAGRAAVDVAKQLEDDDQARHTRDSLYTVAWIYAVRAIRVDSMDGNGHFVQALALGRLSRTKGGKERVRYGRLIYDEAALALRLPGRPDGPHHILGAWHAEVERLSSVTRFFARAFFGGSFLSRASWDSAVVHLEAAVTERPDNLYHHLELAEILIDLKRYDQARAQLNAIAPLAPTSDVLDPKYKKRAVELLENIGKK